MRAVVHIGDDLDLAACVDTLVGLAAGELVVVAGETYGDDVLDALRERLPGRDVTAMTACFEVGENDTTLRSPTAFTGPAYDATEALRLADQRGWAIARDGVMWRRVVAVLRPHALVDADADAIDAALRRGAVVVCAARAANDVDAVVDSGAAAAVMAGALHAELVPPSE